MGLAETELVRRVGSDDAVVYGFADPDEATDCFFKSGRGISREVVEAIAERRNAVIGSGVLESAPPGFLGIAG